MRVNSINEPKSLSFVVWSRSESIQPVHSCDDLTPLFWIRNKRDYTINAAKTNYAANLQLCYSHMQRVVLMTHIESNFIF